MFGPIVLNTVDCFLFYKICFCTGINIISAILNVVETIRVDSAVFRLSSGDINKQTIDSSLLESNC